MKARAVVSLLRAFVLIPWFSPVWAHSAPPGPAPPPLILAQAARPFYEGKTITMIIPFAPAGTTDIGARVVAKHLGKYIPGDPTVITQNMPGAGGMIGANHLYNIAKRDGLTIATISRAHYLEQMVGRPEVQFDFRKFSWIGSFNSALMFLACRTDSGFTGLDKIRAANRPVRIGQGSSGSISFVFSSLVEEALNLKFQNVMGYKSGRDTDLGMERGEVDCRASSDVTTGRSPWREWVENALSLSSCNKDRRKAVSCHARFPRFMNWPRRTPSPCSILWK